MVLILSSGQNEYPSTPWYPGKYGVIPFTLRKYSRMSVGKAILYLVSNDLMSSSLHAVCIGRFCERHNSISWRQIRSITPSLSPPLKRTFKMRVKLYTPTRRLSLESHRRQSVDGSSPTYTGRGR